MVFSRIDWIRVMAVLVSILAGAGVLAIIVWIMQLLAVPLLMLLVAWMLSYVLNPVVDFIESHRLPRPLAALITYLAVVLLLGLALVLLVAPLTAQLAALQHDLPTLAQNLQTRLGDAEQMLQALGLSVQVEQLLQGGAVTTPTGGQVVGSAFTILGNVVSALIHTIITLVLSFYLVLDNRRIGRNMIRVAPEGSRDKVRFAQTEISRVVGGYLRAQLLAALTIGILAGAGCWILGVRYPLVIGLLAGILELVPMLGPILATIPAVGIAAFQPFPLVLWVLLYFFAIQQFENNILIPRLAGHAVGLHPLGALLALVVGTELGGLWGAILAVPVAGLVWVFLVGAYRSLTAASGTQTPFVPPPLPRLPTLSFKGRPLFRFRHEEPSASPPPHSFDEH